MKSYIFQPGTTPQLSLVELTAVLGLKPTPLTESFVVADLADDKSPTDCIDQLGGTVKIYQELQVFPHDTSSETLKEAVISVLIETAAGNKISFSLSEIGRDHLEHISETELKHDLRQAGVPSRYIEAPPGGLSAAVLLHRKNLIELSILQTNDSIYLLKSVSVQNIDAWTVRDRGKPYADRKKGMLPPKVARMMLNINAQYDTSENRLVYDPFCGTGTVLIENMSLGFKSLGSDIDEAAVRGARENMIWAAETLGADEVPQILLADVAHAVPTLPITAIVAEPFLGKPSPKPQQIENIFKGLEKLYLGGFRHWRSILPEGAPITIIFPRSRVGKTVHSMTRLIDKLEELGYTTQSEPLVYARSGAVIEREIYTFIYRNKHVTR
ncbi:MAG: hypothetical protein COY80_04520 [Candidatus Pacebacteria bacterium CG_4_10_14_0_8_um_filter_42_14]|nr:MAG: hypothetical protein COY80_04520 [Candidatus Pacebacteria bacterium CG_4_10_14_0_8_um_filter_42_14]